MNRTVAPAARATLADLARYDGKAELIGGKIVALMAAGFRPGRIAARIFQSLELHSESTGRGLAFTDNIGFAVSELVSERQSFSPDASFDDGPLPNDLMDFIAAPPTLAVEVRSKGDYGPAAEAERAAKRADYFEAGTLVVWDVDPQAEVVRSYGATHADQPAIFGRGQVADAGLAVPGWRIAVDGIFA